MKHTKFLRETVLSTFNVYIPRINVGVQRTDIQGAPGVGSRIVLIQIQMTEKPVLRAEVYARSLRTSYQPP